MFIKKAYLKRDFTIAVNSQIPAEKPGFFRALTYKGIYELADFTINWIMKFADGLA